MFRALPNHDKDPILTNFLRRKKISNKSKNMFLGTFWCVLNKKSSVIMSKADH